MWYTYSILVLKELELSIAVGLDSATDWVCNNLKKSGESIGGVVGDKLVDTADFIKVTTNTIGDSVDQFKHTLSEHLDKHKTKWAEATSNIYNSVKQMWESLF